MIHLLCFINITAQSGNDVITFVLERKGKYPIKHNLYDEGSNYEVRGFLTTEPLILLSLEYIAYQPKVIPVCGLNVGASAILILG